MCCACMGHGMFCTGSMPQCPSTVARGIECVRALCDKNLLRGLCSSKGCARVHFEDILEWLRHWDENWGPVVLLDGDDLDGKGSRGRAPGNQLDVPDGELRHIFQAGPSHARHKDVLRLMKGHIELQRSYYAEHQGTKSMVCFDWGCINSREMWLLAFEEFLQWARPKLAEALGKYDAPGNTGAAAKLRLNDWRWCYEILVMADGISEERWHHKTLFKEPTRIDLEKLVRASPFSACCTYTLLTFAQLANPPTRSSAPLALASFLRRHTAV